MDDDNQATATRDQGPAFCIVLTYFALFLLLTA